MPTGASGQTPDVIRSSDNRIVKLVRSLRRRSVREAERLFVVEGVRAVEDALAAGAVPRFLMTRAADAGSDAIVDRAGVDWDVRAVEPKLFDGLTETLSPQGVLAVFDMPKLGVDLADSPLVLVIDRMRDPGNLGTLLRTAAAAGVSLVALSAETVDQYNPKVVRAAMGAHFRVPIRPWTDDLARAITEACPARLVADADARTPYDAVNWMRGTALVVGSEAHGVSAAMAELATDRVSIPMSANVESLNAAVAGAVLLFEAVRQRRQRAIHPRQQAKT